MQAAQVVGEARERVVLFESAQDHRARRVLLERDGEVLHLLLQGQMLVGFVDGAPVHPGHHQGHEQDEPKTVEQAAREDGVAQTPRQRRGRRRLRARLRLLHPRPLPVHRPVSLAGSLTMPWRARRQPRPPGAYRAASCFWSSKMGRNTDRQIVPTSKPMMAIMMGSIRLVSCFTVALTCSS